MAINKKLIHFTNKTNFLNEYNNGNILPTSIVFIQDAKQIWTHNEFYSCPFTEEEINQLLVGSNIKLNGYTEITSPIEISAADTVNQAFGKIEDYLNSMLSKTEAAENYATKVDLEAASIKWSILGKSELYEWVDLGLPSGLKWATCNIGATKPEDFGLYFAWGETQGYSGITDTKKFNWSDYELCGGSSSTFTKYNNNGSNGTVDNLTVLEQVDDAAYQSDNTCRMPTKSDFEELTANTTSVWETLNGVKGRRFTSKTNGNSIFVPTAGSCGSGSVDYVGSGGGLWSSSLDESNSRDAWGLYFDSDYVYMGISSRCYGFTVRAVKF